MAASDHPVDGLVTCYKTAFAALRQSDQHLEPLYPGARAALDALGRRPDTLLGIATGKSQRGVRAVLGRHGLSERFATIQTADDAPSKPHPGMVLAAMRETGVPPRDTVVVGDTVFDVEMARAAGARAIGVAMGLSSGGSARGGRRRRAARRFLRARCRARSVVDRDIGAGADGCHVVVS